MENEARGEGRERWACGNVVKKGKRGEERRKGKFGHGNFMKGIL
jgi:hypothetical protein